MTSKNYKVTCLECGGTSRLTIVNDQQVMYQDHTPIISARFRRDLQWGFECMCGNDNRICKEEKGELKMLVQNATEGMIKQLANTLKKQDNKQFIMRAA